MTRGEVMQLVRFLLDRIDGDETVLARAARLEGRHVEAPVAPDDAINGTGRLQAETIAKRHVIGDLQLLALLRDLPSERPVREIAINALLHMAAPYRDHRAFRAAWPVPLDRRAERPSEGPDPVALPQL